MNLLSAVLAVAACLFYVFVYTLWLKRTSTSNIVIGGAAGAAPVLIGWSAVTNSLAWAPWCCSPSSSSGPRRTSGPWPSGTRTTTPPPTCRCCPSVATLRADVGPDPRLHGRRCGSSRWCSPRWPTWARSTGSSAVVLGAVFTGFAVRLLQDPSPEAGHAPLQLLDHLRHPAVRRHGARRAGALRAVSVALYVGFRSALRPCVESRSVPRHFP